MKNNCSDIPPKQTGGCDMSFQFDIRKCTIKENKIYFDDKYDGDIISQNENEIKYKYKGENKYMNEIQTVVLMPNFSTHMMK